MNRVIFLALMWLTFSSWGRNSVWMNDFYLYTAETAQVPIILSNETAVTNIQCDVQLPVWCDETNTTFTLGNLTQNGTLTIAHPNLLITRLSIKCAAPIKAGTGEVAMLTIEAPCYLRDSYTINISNIKLTNQNGALVAAKDTKCTINPDALQVGDLSGDGIIDVADINRLIDHILGVELLSDVTQADFDNNRIIDVTDLSMAINAILGFDTTYRPYATSLEDLQQMLNQAYLYSNYAFLELCTDNLVDNQAPDKNGNQYMLEAFQPSDSVLFSWGDVTTHELEDTPENIWKSCYQAINTCNAVLQQLPRFDHLLDGRIDTDEECLYHSIKGEALVSRAYHHWLLASVFCMPWAGDEKSAALPGVPYMLTPGDPVTDHVGRGTLLDTYTHIEQDLRNGIAELPHDADVYQWPCYHFVTRSAHAFAAKFYLTKRDYEKAQAYATLTFNGGQPSLNTFWHASNLNYGTDHVLANCNPGNPGVLLSIPTYSVWSRRPGSRYGCKDDASSATIYGPGPNWSRSLSCFQNKIFYNGSTDYGYMFYANWGELFEYTDKQEGIGYVHMMRNEFTADETLLVRAEARIFLGDIDGALNDLKMWVQNRNAYVYAGNIESFYTRDPEAISYINKPMHIDEVCPSSKYQVTDEMMPYLQCVQHFQRIETIHTGKRWFDIKRYGIEIEHAVGGRTGGKIDTLTVNDKRRAIQIPDAAINAGLQPNPR